MVKVVGADRGIYIYAGTQLISEFGDAASNTYSAGTTPGQAGSDSTATMLYQHSDHLTTRVTSDNNGDLSNEQAHYPYGEQWYAGGTADPSVLRKFTSYQREDEATNGKLNYAVFREQSARVGRFHMADPKRGNVGNPQRLNRYAYVLGDPANRVDPRGLDIGFDGGEPGGMQQIGGGWTLSIGTWAFPGASGDMLALCEMQLDFTGNFPPWPGKMDVCTDIVSVLLPVFLLGDDQRTPHPEMCYFEVSLSPNKVACPTAVTRGTARMTIGGIAVNQGFLKDIKVTAESLDREIFYLGPVRNTFGTFNWDADFTLIPSKSKNYGIIKWTMKYKCSTAVDPKEEKSEDFYQQIACK